MLANCLEMTGIKICTYKKINADGGNISRDRLREELAKYEATALSQILLIQATVM